MARLYANNASTTLASNISDSATSLTVATGDGALFPALSGGDTFVVTLEQGSTREIVEVTARSGDALTIVRAREGTTAAAFTAGAVVELRITASAATRWENTSNAAFGGFVPSSVLGGYVPWRQALSQFGSANPQLLGFNASGAGTAQNGATTSATAATRKHRWRRISAASAGSPAFYGTNNVGFELNRGLLVEIGFCWSDAVFSADGWGFAGVRHQSFDQSNPPSSQTQIVGVGCDPGDATMSLYYNDGAGTATKLGLGSAFPANSVDTDWFRLQLACARPLADVVADREWYYDITNEQTGARVVGVVSSNVPDAASSALLNAGVVRNTGAGTTAVATDISHIAFAWVDQW